MINNPFLDGQRAPTENPYNVEYSEVDQYGRHFRRVGNCIEYEPEINGIRQSVFFASQKAQKEREKINRNREAEAMKQAQTGRHCPIKISRNNTNINCEKSCAFYVDNSCMLARADTPATRDTKGKDCIIARKCNEYCAMYNHGCTLIDIVKGIKPGKE